MFYRFTLSLLAILAAATGTSSLYAEDTLPPASERFKDAAGGEEPSFQRHLLPLMGRLGCNGRACHGSFQGQGGFRLSLFGYDFKADHDALTKGDKPRVDLKEPVNSLIVFKPTHEDEHEGGQRMEVGSWQFNIFRKWIEAGAKDDSAQQARLERLEVTPSEIQFRQDGEKTQLKAVAVWSNGDREDVTPICRFQTNDGSIATVDEQGQITCTGKGDTHIVVFYDNGITPVPVIQPVSAEIAAKYPQVPTPTKIDELVVQKLKKLGVVPSELSTDEEFLRRVSLDITGTLPAPSEVEAFVADASADKREKKVDELLERPAYAAWWATRLCDLTGNNATQMGNNNFRNEESRQWYQWLEGRIAKNMPYDEIVAGIVLATGRKEGQSFREYCEEMSQYYRSKDPVNFAEHDTLPHFWARRNLRQPEEKALSFAYAFLGVRLQCAQCHKHPFDQWSQSDFEHFQAFFTNIQYNYRPTDKAEREKLQEELGLDPKKPNNQQRADMVKFLGEGKTIPFQEVFVNNRNPNRKNDKNDKNKKNGGARVVTPKVLGGDEAAKADEGGDLRDALMDWMRDEKNPYFAKAVVNRVWANYFNVGIIEPPDDQNLANPPSNEALLQHLTDEFIAHKYDLKWLHRTIVLSRTYQLSWRPNPTNRLDTRNFSRAVPRRLPAEIVYDALRMATAGEQEQTMLFTSVSDRAIGPNNGVTTNGTKGGYAMQTFGKPARATNCDCERSMEPSLLQTLFLRNDGEMLTLIDRNGGWVQEVAKESAAEAKVASTRRADRLKEAGNIEKLLARTKQQLGKLDKEKDKDEIAQLQNRQTKLERQLKEAKRLEALAKAESEAAAAKEGKVDPKVVAERGPEVIRQAYLRTLSRNPTPDEMAKAQDYLAESSSLSVGVRDLLWALLNTKEFIVNH